MKKIILILGFLIFALLGYPQDEGENLNIDNAKLNNLIYGIKSGGIDTIIGIHPDSIGQFYLKNITDPILPLDGVNFRTLQEFLYTEPRDSILFNKDISDLIHQEAKFYYDSTKQSFVGYIGETDVTFEFMYEDWIRVYNNSGVTIENGKVGYLTGIVLDANNTVTVSLAQSDSAATCLSTLGVATHDIEPSSYGILTRSGTVRDVNTPLFGFSTSGELGYLSHTTPGLITPNPPPSPNHLIRLGNVGKIDASTGTFEVHIDIGGNTGSVIKIFNGATLENTTVDVTSDGVTNTVSIEAQGGGDLSLFFDGIFHVFDATPAATIAIPSGTDTIPVRNWVYIPNSTRVLTVNTTAVSIANGFPTNEQYVPVADIITPSAATAQARGFNKVHAWTDHLSNPVDQGHMSDINFWIRKQPATYISGFALTTDPLEDIFNDSIEVSFASGSVLQLHPHNCNAQSTTTGDSIKVYNDPDFSNRPIKDLNSTDLNQDSEGVSLVGQFYTVTLWSVISEDTGDCQLFMNLPSGSYNNASSALLDASEFRNTRIPSEYKGAAVLLYSLVLQNSGTDIKIVADGITDLREDAPPPGGAGGTGGITSYDELDDTPVNKIGSSNKLVGVNVGESAHEYKNFTVDASGNTIIGGTLSVTGVGTFSDDLELNADLIDINDSPGTAGQVLSSLGVGLGVDWVDASGGVSNHSGLTELDYASAGHTGFAGTGVTNTFTGTNRFEAAIPNVFIKTTSSTPFGGLIFEDEAGVDKFELGYNTTSNKAKISSIDDLQFLSNGFNAGEIASSDQQWKFNTYTTTTSHVVTPVGMLVFDASGNIGTQSISGGGDVFKVGTPVNEQVGTWTGDGTLAGYASYTFNKSLTDPEIKLFASSATGASGVTFYDQTDTQQFAVGYDNNADQSVLLSSQTILFGAGINFMTLSSSEFDVQGDINVGGYFKDSSGDVGTSGQVLSSTVTGTDWIDAGGSSLWTLSGSEVYRNSEVWIGTASELTTDVGYNLQVSGAAHIEAANPIIRLESTTLGNKFAFKIGSDVATMSFNTFDVWNFDESLDLFDFESSLKAEVFITENANAQSTSAATINLDTRDNADFETITLSGDIDHTVNINYIEDGQAGEIRFRQDAGAGETITIATFSDNAVTGLTEEYDGGFKLINAIASGKTSVQYKRIGNDVRILVSHLAQ